MPGRRPLERLALHRFASPWLRHQHLARYRWAAGRAGGKRVLDLASGAGYGSALLASGGARWVVSADRAGEAFREAALPRSRAGPLRGALADAARLPFADASFDLYVSFETIEHVADDRSAVREARRVLAPGGMFLCSTPEREVISPGRTLADPPDNPYHRREYSRTDFEALLRPEFGTIRWYGQTRCPDTHKRRLEALARLSPGAALRFHQLRNILRLPAEREGRHAPYRLSEDGGWPEVLIAVCGPVGGQQPVDKVARRSSGDPSRRNRGAARRSSLRCGRNTPGIPPLRASSAGRLAALGAHATLSTGC